MRELIRDLVFGTICLKSAGLDFRVTNPQLAAGSSVRFSGSKGLGACWKSLLPDQTDGTAERLLEAGGT